MDFCVKGTHRCSFGLQALITGGVRIARATPLQLASGALEGPGYWSRGRQSFVVNGTISAVANGVQSTHHLYVYVLEVSIRVAVRPHKVPNCVSGWTRYYSSLYAPSE